MCWRAFKPPAHESADDIRPGGDVLALQDEIRRSPDARYDHRLHGVLLVEEGMSCRRVAETLGDSHGTVANWVARFEKHGFAGLNDQAVRGRRPRLERAEMKQVEIALRKSPAHCGLAAQLWDGPLLSSFLEKRLGIVLRARQCQRLFRRLGDNLVRFVSGWREGKAR